MLVSGTPGTQLPASSRERHYLPQAHAMPAPLEPPPPPCVTFRLVVVPLWGLGSHPFLPLHVVSGCCFLSATAAGALAGVVSANIYNPYTITTQYYYRGCRVQNSGPWDAWLPVVENNQLFAQCTVHPQMACVLL